MDISALTKMTRHLFRLMFTSHPRAATCDLSGKVIIVTGASPNSVGYATAKQLLIWGATVVITSRSETEQTADTLRQSLDAQLDSGDVVGHTLDLTDVGSVQKFCQWYQQRFGNQLDVLINNAGIHLDLLGQWQQPTLSDDGHEIHWRTNYLGTAMLTHLLLPCLKHTGLEFGEARVVNVSSHLHCKGLNAEFFAPQRAYNSWQAYGQSKLALLHHAFELQRLYAKSHNIQAYSLHPGSIATEISHKGLADTGFVQKMRQYLAPLEAMILLSPDEGAQTQLLCATASDLLSGGYYQRCELNEASSEAMDHSVAHRLWLTTENWIAQTLADSPHPNGEATILQGHG